MAWSNFWETMDFITISIKSELKNKRSSNHHVGWETLLFKLWVLLVSHENLMLELSGEVDGHGLDSLDKATLPTMDFIHFSAIANEFVEGNKSWHCFIVINSSDHVQSLISWSDFSVFCNMFWVPETELFISMNCAAQWSEIL